jgi:hypothetical protein
MLQIISPNTETKAAKDHRFEGTLIQFGTDGLENWEKVMERMEMEYSLMETIV